MQQLTAYQFDANFNAQSDAESCFTEVHNKIIAWLSSKGASTIAAESGEFKSLSGEGLGQFKIEKTSARNSELNEYLLEEISRHDQEFITKISVIRSLRTIRVYASLSASNSKTIIAPIPFEARCPKVVRDIIAMNYPWMVGGETKPFSKAQCISDSNDSLILANWIISRDRALPIILVSLVEGEEFWENISEGLAYDLTGLAQVYVIDRPASFSIFQKIGKTGSCYNGAIRIIWPNVSGANADDIRSFVWTSQNLLSHKFGEDGAKKFRSYIRKQILPIASFSITPPKEISTIKSDAVREEINKLKTKAGESDKIQEIANKLADENISLQIENEKLRDSLAEALTRASNYEAQYEELRNSRTDDTQETSEEKDPIGPSNRPAPGTVMYFKKTHSAPGFDYFVERGDCGCNNWQSSNAGEKARKGFIRRFDRDDWKSLHHCASCTGGGVWRVIW